MFDLDPSGDQPAELRAAALAVRDLLAELGLPSFVKTSGSKGFHIVVALDGEADFEPVRRLSQGAGAVLVKRHPALFTQEFIKADRGGRIFVDTGRNGYGATFAAVYALRPKPGAPVSAPCTWPEIESGAVGPQTFTLRTLSARLAEVGDLWQALHARPHSLRDATAALERLLTEEDWKDSLAATTRRPVSRKRTRQSPLKPLTDSGRALPPDQRVRGDPHLVANPRDHCDGQVAAPIEHLGHPGAAPDDRHQIGAGQAHLLHTEENRVDRIGRVDRLMLGLVRIDQGR